MPPRKQWIDKKNATTYQLFHRPQHDPLIHDSEADDRVLHQVSGPPPAPAAPSSTSSTSTSTSTSSKGAARNLKDLEREFGRDSIRGNEGEAANYGIFFDDTKYDYMQHMRDLGSGGGEAHFVEAKTNTDRGKGKGKGMKLEDALAAVDLDGTGSADGYGGGSVVGGSVAGGSRYGGSISNARSTTTSYTRKPTYQDQQDIPDAIAGFQPDMDPRLRETLEALEDDAFVDDDDDADVFGKLTSSAEEVDPEEWEDGLFDDVDEEEEDDGWESDATEKAPIQPESTAPAPTTGSIDESEHETQSEPASTSPQTQQPETTTPAPGDLPSENAPIPDLPPEDQGWMREFAKYKKDIKTKHANPPPNAAPSIAPSNAQQTGTGISTTMFTAGGTPIRHKKRKGAMTNPTSFSMTSSALARTEGHRLLDDRFERLERLYAVDEEDEDEEGSVVDDNMSMASGMSGVSGMSSQAPSLVSVGNAGAGAGAGAGASSSSNANGGVPLGGGFNQIMDEFLDQCDDMNYSSAQAKKKGAKAKRGKNGNEAVGMRMLDEVRRGLGPAKVSARRTGRV